jgi:hypothetical protein
MQMRRTLENFASWISLFAILMASFGPSVSHATAAEKSDQSWGEICSVAGTKLVKVSSTADPAAFQSTTPAKDALQVHHCPLCSGNGKAWAMTAQVVPASPALLSGYSFLVPALDSPESLVAWAVPHSRAPPVLAS